MKKCELESFYNKGFGWVCKSCETKNEIVAKEKSRLMIEGEAENKTPVFSNKAIAKWADNEQTTLICPICEAKESLS